MYEIGDKVKIRVGNIYYDQSGGTDGVIINISGVDHPYRVSWGNDHKNSYRESDIELVSNGRTINDKTKLIFNFINNGKLT